MNDKCLIINNCQAKMSKDIPIIGFTEFRDSVITETQIGARVVSFFAKVKEEGRFILVIVLARDKEGTLAVFSTEVKESYHSLTLDVPQVHLFEREIFEQWGIRPNGHPWLRPVRFHQPYSEEISKFVENRKARSAKPFLRISGQETHQVSVGPVHAGIIEPGHFLFQCHGEKVFNLEISLGYQHRGLERSILSAPSQRLIHYMETAAGDTTIGHCLAYCQAIEALADCRVPLRAAAIRGILLELERLANHTGDLGALANDIGYLPTTAYCGRLRGDFLNMTAYICGNRFGRNIVRPGGLSFDLDFSMIKELIKRLEETFEDVKNAVSLLWDSSLVVERFDETGILTKINAIDLGIVGVAARACGIERDVRFDFPTGIFKFSQIPVSTHSSGDVFSRAFVRWLEIQRSFEFIRDQLKNLPEGNISHEIGNINKDRTVVSLIEAWRGEIAHIVFTDNAGKICDYKITDPSFHNWLGLAIAVRGEAISDFPICNKSFNLSYCGHDL
ncbi:MAG: NADH-quinone oxidoreductase subunit C [Candidatus Omnitrophica bacterium]|nr:NADH-quinone oxidoreductase subunit C [Candidatus Omnitrophota bacterium]